MIKSRVSSPEHLAEARRLLEETAALRTFIALRAANPRRLVRNPCGDTSCGTCYGTVEQAEQTYGDILEAVELSLILGN